MVELKSHLSRRGQAPKHLKSLHFKQEEKRGWAGTPEGTEPLVGEERPDSPHLAWNALETGSGESPQEEGCSNVRLPTPSGEVFVKMTACLFFPNVSFPRTGRFY